MLIFFVYFLYISIRKQLLILPIILILILGTFTQSFKSDYRKVSWSQITVDNQVISNDQTYLYKLKAFMWLAEKKFNEVKDLKFLMSKDILGKNNNIKRLFHSADSLILISKLTPDVVEYWNGYTYKILSTKLVPRILWKNKPSDVISNEAGRRYTVQGPNDFSTSWNLPVLNEFYANFGLKGVIFGMFLVGFLLRLVSGLNFFKISNNSFSFVIGSVILFPLTFFEIHLSMLFGALIQTFLFLIIFIICAKFSYTLLEKIIIKIKN